METRSWQFESSSSDQTYRTQLGDDGHLSCDCKGFTFKRPNKPRECKHITRVISQEGFVTEVRYGMVFVVGEREPAPEPPPEVSAEPHPDQVPNPMLCSKSDEPIAALVSSGLYVMEEKLDGHRCVLHVVRRGSGRQVTAWSRPQAGAANRRDLPRQVLAAARQLPVGIYDGELIVPAGHSWDVTGHGATARQQLVLFDLLAGPKGPVISEPYERRRELLTAAIAKAELEPEVDPPLILIAVCEPSVEAIQAIWACGGEGVVLKRRGSPYRPGTRSPSWIKVKRRISARLTITGFKAGLSGPFATVCLRDADGNEATVKTRDSALYRQFEANPDAFVGQDVWIEYQQRTPSGAYYSPVLDRLVE